MTTFIEMLQRVVAEATALYGTICDHPDLVSNEADLNEWAGDVLNDLRDMRYLLQERLRRG